MSKLMRRRAVASRPPRSPKSKTVTFTGCWTCSSRKVKCDERRRNGCGVCERAGLDCAGYGVNLCWVTDAKHEWQGARRSAIKPYQFTTPALSDEEILKALSAIDAISTPSSTVMMGPFAIFPANRRSGGQWSRGSDEPAHTVPEARHGHYEDASHINSDILELGGDSCDPLDSTLSDLWPHHSLAQTLVLFDDPDGPAATHPRSDTAISPDPELADSSSLALRLSMPLFRDRQTSRLMYHYMNHVAELLQPVLHPRNPWRTTYLPFALEGCPDRLLYQTSTGSSSSASVALFHSLLSAAAFHLRNSTIDNEEFHQLALQHRIKALQALNTAASHPTDVQNYGVHLTAMLSLVTVDTMAGEDSDFPVHLKACYQLQKPPEYHDVVGNSDSPIYSICRFLTLLARTTAPVIVARPWPIEAETSFYQPHFRSDERSVEHMYGITPMLGNMLGKTCKIAEHLAFYRVGHETIPSGLQDACYALGTEVFSWTIDAEPFGLLEREESTMREIARCQARAFHGAVLIYYYRTLVKNGLTAEWVVDVEDHVKHIWQNLTDAEDLKDAYTGGIKRSAPMSWPAFIGACEAIDRQPWIMWWERVNGYCIGNFARQWQIIQELWSIQDTGSRISWREALAQTGKLVLPI